MSDDGRFAIVVIALLGNPFSPAYARQRLRAHAEGTALPCALGFCSLHVALYGPDKKLWALTETGISDDARTPAGVTIGKSQMRWENGELSITIAERCAPWGRPLRGTVRIIPESEPRTSLALEPRGAHTWWPVAPLSRIEVSLLEPNVRFSGHGYHDANAGDEPIPEAFLRWTWSRARVGDAAIVTYDTELRGGQTTGRALEITRDGAVRELCDLPEAKLPTTLWGLSRQGRGKAPQLFRTLEDTPFYARALVQSTYRGQRVLAMHEELSGARLEARWVRFLLGFRMRRRPA